jgi:hypothetical protein
MKRRFLEVSEEDNKIIDVICMDLDIKRNEVFKKIINKSISLEYYQEVVNKWQKRVELV